MITLSSVLCLPFSVTLDPKAGPPVYLKQDEGVGNDKAGESFVSSSSVVALAWIYFHSFSYRIPVPSQALLAEV